MSEKFIRTETETLTARYPELTECVPDIIRAFEIIRDCYRKGGTLLVCGNGGSGADSEHITGELMKEFAIKRPLSDSEKEKLKEISPADGELLGKSLQGALKTIPLTGNIALSTAYMNDAVPELVFAQQVYGYGDENSVLLGISTSGNSKNVIYAVETARLKNMAVIGLSGQSGGKLAQLCDVCIKAPSKITADIQEYHLPIYHSICRMLEDEFFGEADR